ncbi:MAG: HdeA family protein [Desulfovibrio sp.]|nr:HdeA family protein [Desulfovibrio sp.]
MLKVNPEQVPRMYKQSGESKQKSFGGTSMKKTLLLTTLAALLLCAPSAGFADDETDMAKISCKDFLGSGDQMGTMLAWIDGYMSAKSDNTMMSKEWMEKLGKHMGEYCAKNPGNTIMQAMDAMPSE